MRKIRTLPIPRLAMTWTGWVLERVADHVTHRPPLATYKAVSYTARHLFYDTTKARTELGLAPGPIEESLERAIAWFRRVGYIRR